MATRSLDPYAALGVSRSADEGEIRSAYRRLARENHPDVNKDPAAEDRFKEVAQAYEILRDPERRAEYDAGGGTRRGGPSPRSRGTSGYGGFDDVHVDFGDGVDASDLFEQLFRGGGGRGRGFGGFDGFGRGFSGRGRDVEATLELSLEEAARGGPRHISIDGHDYEVTIPAGVRDGQLIRLAGEGDPGGGGGPSGDLLLRIRLRPHPRFRVDGDDLLVDLPVAPWEAALGAQVPVETLTGRARVRVPPGSSSGKRLRLRGEGLGPEGDLYATVMIHVPRSLSDEERRLFEELRDVSSFNPREER
ncbi:MAG: chaperone DnaJ domain protein [Solirubrobacterales bacterium]|jgi:curved DNA-binding protein|nr:chaperone DnaJ domain protein [Solirubrobacterales bacterium]